MVPKLCMVMSPPRCGSMWLYNALRLTLRSAGLSAKPNEIAVGLDNVMALIKSAMADDAPQNAYVVKMHSVLDLRRDGVLAATVLRDPRDMAVSFQQFMGVEASAQSAPTTVAFIIELYKKLEEVWGQTMLGVRYEDIVDNPASAVASTRRALGLPDDSASDMVIAKELAPESVQRIIDSAKSGRLQDQPLEAFEGARAIDGETGFQTGHISDRATGKWRSALPPDELHIIHDRFGDWLAGRGYSLL